jgi:tetratricopeptide (TPR) repeat protein
MTTFLGLKPMKKAVSIKSIISSAFVACTLFAAPVFIVGVAVAAESSSVKTKIVPTLRTKVYDQLARAQEIADGGNVAEAIKVLDKVKSKQSTMNEYEIAMMHNFYGFIYYADEQVGLAIESFEEVVEIDLIPETLEQSTLYSLAQLHMSQGNFDKTITFVERWEALQTKPIPAKTLLLKAQAMYQKKDFAPALEYISDAIALVEVEKGIAEENWYVLQRAVYFEMKQPEQVKDVLVKMVKFFNEPKYWVQLAGMYGELGEEKKQLAVMEAAYQQGFVTKGSDLFNLAQLYYYHQTPIKGAVVMEKALEAGVMEKDLRNLKFLAQSLTAAQENEKAVPVMTAAAELSESGELNAQLAQIYLNLEKWDNAIEQGRKALDKGELRNPGTTHLVLGMAHFNKREFVEALDELAMAEKDDRSRGMAQQWSKFVTSERQQYETLQASLYVGDSIGG